MAEAALRALTKLEQVMPPALRRRVRGLHAAVVPLGPAGPTVDAEILTLLATASRAHRAVQLAYCDRHGRNTERVVEPHGLVHTGPRWYVVAFDRGRNDLRTFRVDRITDAVEIDSTFTPRTIPGGDLAAYVSQAIGSDPYVYRARVVLHEGHAALARRTPASVGRLTALDERRTLFETGSNSLGLLAVHLGWLGVEMEVLDPLELVGAMQTLGNALLRSVERSKVSRSSAAAEPQ
jgi:predicted DNA-binding transcriptional regulator YafY